MTIRLPSDAVGLIREGLEWNAEYARAILLDGYEVIGVVRLGGGYDRYEVGITSEAVFVPAMKHGADGIILAHSHPASPWPIASNADVLLTARYYRLGKELGITIQDHIIVTKERYMSFQEAGLMRIIRETTGA